MKFALLSGRVLRLRRDAVSGPLLALWREKLVTGLECKQPGRTPQKFLRSYHWHGRVSFMRFALAS